jgi:hypothetical protein
LQGCRKAGARWLNKGGGWHALTVSCFACATWAGVANCVVVAHVHCLHCLQVVCSTSLVPGDRIVVSPGTMSCDAVLLRGEAIVDENMLTGRSMQQQWVQHWLPAPVMGATWFRTLSFYVLAVACNCQSTALLALHTCRGVCASAQGCVLSHSCRAGIRP